MDVSLGPFAKVAVVGSAILFTVFSLGAIQGNVIGGLLFMCPILFALWAGIFKITVFLSEGDSIELPIPGYPPPEDIPESDYDELFDSVPEAGELYTRTDAPRVSGSPTSRIIGENARRRVECAEGASYRRGPIVYSGGSKPRKPASEDSEFADFLRSTPF